MRTDRTLNGPHSSVSTLRGVERVSPVCLFTLLNTRYTNKVQPTKSSGRKTGEQEVHASAAFFAAVSGGKMAEAVDGANSCVLPRSARCCSPKKDPGVVELDVRASQSGGSDPVLEGESPTWGDVLLSLCCRWRDLVVVFAGSVVCLVAR